MHYVDEQRRLKQDMGSDTEIDANEELRRPDSDEETDEEMSEEEYEEEDEEHNAYGDED